MPCHTKATAHSLMRHWPRRRRMHWARPWQSTRVIMCEAWRVGVGGGTRLPHPLRVRRWRLLKDSRLRASFRCVRSVRAGRRRASMFPAKKSRSGCLRVWFREGSVKGPRRFRRKKSRRCCRRTCDRIACRRLSAEAVSSCSCAPGALSACMPHGHEHACWRVGWGGCDGEAGRQL